MKKTINVQNNVLKNLLYAALFVALFIVIHAVFEFGTIAIYAYLKGLDLFNVAQSMQSGKYSDVLIAANLLSSVAAILIYIKMKWAPISRTYLQNRGECYSGLLCCRLVLFFQHSLFTKNCKLRCPTI